MSVRNTFRLAASAFLATFLFSASAQACSYPAGEEAFSQWGDHRAYVLVPNGDFSSGSAGWTLEGGATVASEALSLPAGSSALSPPICVSSETPFLRSMARDSGVAGAKLRVEIVSEALEATRNRVVAGDKGEDWGPTQPLAQNFGLLGGGDSSVRIRVTAVGGDWLVDNVYVDPFARY
ncbi:MAG: hypothetical protein ACTHO8_10935 [Solirubrobacterales bacterium]